MSETRSASPDRERAGSPSPAPDPSPADGAARRGGLRGLIRSIPQAVAVALVGGLAGPALLVAAYGLHPGFALQLDRELPGVTSGFYPAEHSAEGSFVWTSRQAGITLADLDRRSEWSCSIRFRGARPDRAQPQPDVVIALDGVTVAVRTATNDFQDIEVTAPPRPLKPGLILTLASSTVFVPGDADRRELGVQVTRLGCRPAGAWTALPPRRALGSAAGAAAIFGAAFGLTGMTAGSAIGAAALIAAGQAYPLSMGAAPYEANRRTVLLLAFWIACLMVAGQRAAEAWMRGPFRNTARFVAAAAAGVLYLKLLALFHPSKALVDAVFQAHRFEWVLGGRFYFTQLSTSATPFPYAIGLYLAAAPWSLLTDNHVALLRIVVCASEAAAGALLYLMVVRTWGDRLAGAVAAALSWVLPVSFVVVGHANLTNAFGQSVGVAVVAAVTLFALRSRHYVSIALLIVLATLAFISHVTTLAVLLATLLVVAALFRFAGEAALRTPARMVLVVAVSAALLSVLVYWGHFGDVYLAQFERMRTGAAAGATAGAQPAAVVESAAGAAEEAPALGRRFIPLGGRVADAVTQTAANIGWPILALALVGAWRLWTGGHRDRLALVVAAWAVTCAFFVAVSVLSSVEMRYQQDSWEFVGRVEHATAPAAAILAAHGAMWAWRAGTVLRWASAALLLGAVITGVRAWTAWLR